MSFQVSDKDKLDKPDADASQTVTKEGKQGGKVTSEVYFKYLKAVNSSIMVGLVALLFVGAQTMQSGIDFFVSIW